MHFRVCDLCYKDFSSLGVCSLAPPTLTLVLPWIQTWRSSSCSAWPSVTLWITACYSGSTALSLSILTVWVTENTNIAPVWLLQDETYLPNVIILLSWLRQSTNWIKSVTVEKRETWPSEIVIDVFVWTLVTTPFIISSLLLCWKMVCLILCFYQEQLCRILYSLTLISLKVNIDHRTREETKQRLLEPTPNSLNEVQAKVYSLMEKDSFPRFIRSKIYQDLLNRTQIYCQRKSV